MAGLCGSHRAGDRVSGPQPPEGQADCFLHQDGQLPEVIVFLQLPETLELPHALLPAAGAASPGHPNGAFEDDEHPIVPLA